MKNSKFYLINQNYLILLTVLLIFLLPRSLAQPISTDPANDPESSIYFHVEKGIAGELKFIYPFIKGTNRWSLDGTHNETNAFINSTSVSLF